MQKRTSAATEATAVCEKQSAKLRERAKRLLIQKQFQRAVEVCNEALNVTPGNYKVLRIRSAAWCQLGEYQQALADADFVLKEIPYSGDSWYQKGYSHFHLKDYAAAAHAFAQGLDCNSADRSLQHGFTDALMLMASAKVSRIMDCPTTDATDTNATGATSLAEYIPCAAHVKADSVTPDLVAHPRQGDSQEQGGDEVASVGVAGVDEVLPEVSRQDEEELEDGTVVCEQGGDGEELEDDTLVREGNPGGSMQGSQAVDGEACEAVRGGALDETLGDQMEDGGADEVAAGNGGADVETGGDAPPAAGGADAQE